ncbi:MAG: UDP-glucose 4-epimerase GalE [Candidatus Solibacter usitatus]|nr:UDP-glucose 4-epimerase GalE [Candidatus Solibacter usitatus]
MARILVTGGAGYIGSHTTHYLLARGHDVQVLDDLSKGYAHNVPKGRLHVVNLHDSSSLDQLLAAHRFDAVVHFAAFIAVGESAREPERYFRNNAGGSLALLEAIERHGVRRLVFSSTAAVYGNPERVPIPESAPLLPVSPYGESKLMTETALKWLDACSGLRYVALRYFNACGAEAAFGIGEEHEPETHLIPLVFRAIRTGVPLTVFGGDYATPDGTCIRDYIHVSDLASAHLAALDSLLAGGASGVFNAGTGRGYSVLEVLRAAGEVTGKKVPFVMGPRREGDPAELVADSSKLRKTLGWAPQYDSLSAMVESAWGFENRRHGPAGT